MKWDLKNLLILSIGHLSCDINGGSIPALLPFLAAMHNLDYQECGFLAFAFSSVSSVIQPFFGLFSDKRPSMSYIPIGIFLACLGMCLAGFVSSYFLICLSLLLSGIGAAIFHPEGARYANIAAGERKSTGISIFSIGGNLGHALGPVFVAFLIGGYTFSQVKIGGFGLHGMAFYGFLAVFASLLAYHSLTKWNPIYSSLKKRSISESAQNDWNAFFILVICIVCRSITFVGFTTFFPMYWAMMFNSSVQIGSVILSAFLIVGVCSNMLGGILADRFGNVFILKSTFLCIAPTLFLFTNTTNPISAVLLLIPFAFFKYAHFSSMILLGQKYLAKNMGFASGITLGVSLSLGGMTTPILGWVADNYGGLHASFHCLTVIMLIGAVFSLFIKQPNKG